MYLIYCIFFFCINKYIIFTYFTKLTLLLFHCFDKYRRYTYNKDRPTWATGVIPKLRLLQYLHVQRSSSPPVYINNFTTILWSRKYSLKIYICFVYDCLWSGKYSLKIYTCYVYDWLWARKYSLKRYGCCVYDGLWVGKYSYSKYTYAMFMTFYSLESRLLTQNILILCL